MWCAKKREEFEKKEKEKLKSIRTEEEVWRYINKFKKKKEKIDENIDLESWKAHFMDLLRGSNERKITRIEMNEDMESKKQERVDDEVEETEQQQMREELIAQLKKLKKGKAPGEDGIENEAWRLMPKEIGEVMWKLLSNIWKNGDIPDDWNKGMICPIFKKGEKSDVKNYRGITLMDSAYKIYANILNERLSRNRR